MSVNREGMPIWGNIVRIMIYIILIIAGLAIGWYFVPATVHYRVLEEYQFLAENESVVFLAVVLPKTGAYQSVSVAQVTWQGAHEIEKHPGFDIIKLEGQINAGQTITGQIEYQVVLRQGRARWEGAVLDFHLQSQPEIESDHPVLVRQAAEIASGQSRKDAYSIYKFTSDYLTWPVGTRIGGNQSALTAYTTGEGGCGEFANLMIALGRASQIPAQAITGLALPAYPPFWSSTSTWGHPGGAHAWVEFYSSGYWELADPSWASSLPGLFKPLWFGRNDGSHLSYGENGQYLDEYADLMVWGEQHGVLVGAMSNPLRFVAAADMNGVTFTPSVSLEKGWDGRWAAAAGFYFGLIFLIRWIEVRLKRARRSS